MCGGHPGRDDNKNTSKTDLYPVGCVEGIQVEMRNLIPTKTDLEQEGCVEVIQVEMYTLILP